MPAVLIVCSANLCRSPMGEAILKRIVANRADASEWRIESAGLSAGFDGRPVDLAQSVMQSMGLDISTHRSKPVSARLLREFDVILVMERWQKDWLVQLYPQAAERVFLVSQMAGREVEIEDPMGGGILSCQAAARKLEQFLYNGLDRLIELTGS